MAPRVVHTIDIISLRKTDRSRVRYFFAILSLAIAAVLLVLGIGQRTFLAPATSVKHAITETTPDSEYVVIPAEIFSLEKGNPSVVVSGQQVFIALAEQRDVDGWLQPNRYDVVQAQTDTKQLSVEQVVPEATPADPEAEADASDDDEQGAQQPAGSDLWLAEYTGETSLKVAVSPGDTQAILVTSSDPLTTPDDVYVIWAQERTTPLAGPLLATGALFAALGIILYLFAVDHDRRGLGPRRGRKGPFQGLRNRRLQRRSERDRSVQSDSRRGSKLGFSVAGLAAVAIAATGCSPSYWPQPTAPEPEVIEETVDDSLAVVPVTDQQIDTILGRVVEAANAGDDALDASLLEDRFEGPALRERVANYVVRGAAEGTAPLPHLTADRLRYDLVQSTEKWPRTLFLTVQSSDVLPPVDEPDAEATANDDEEIVDLPAEDQEQSPTLVLLLTQQTPHDNYKLHNIVSLRGGIEMPAAAPLDEGTAVLANDIKTLRLAPKDAVDALANIMQNGPDDIEESLLFSIEGDTLLEKFGANWPLQNCIEGLKCSQSVTRTEDRVTTLSTGQGGALVVASLTELHIMEIENERDQVKLSDVEMALGLEGSYSQVTREWQHNILLFVPNVGSEEPIHILGSSTQVVDATGTEKEGV